MNIQNLLAAGFKPADAIKGSEKYGFLVKFLKDMPIAEQAELILDFQYYEMTEDEWTQEMAAREIYNNYQEELEHIESESEMQIKVTHILMDEGYTLFNSKYHGFIIGEILWGKKLGL